MSTVTKTHFLRLLLFLFVSTTAFGQTAKEGCLPTGVCLDPAGRSFDAGNMPLAMIASPEGDRLVLSLNGWRQQGIQIVDPQSGKVEQTITQPSAFLGLAFSPEGQKL